MLELRKRLRISLLGALTMITVVALAISHFYTSLRAARLQRELTAVRRTFGYPDVISNNEIASGLIRIHAEHAWSFRVFKPAGQSLVVRCATNGIGHEWLPPHEKETPVPLPRDEPGEVFVHVRFIERAAEYFMTISCDGGSGFSRTIEMPLPAEHPLVRSHFPFSRAKPRSVGEGYGFNYFTPANNLRLWKTAEGTEPHILFARAEGLTGERAPGANGNIYHGAAVWLEAVEE
jgi:hypothetical protein